MPQRIGPEPWGSKLRRVRRIGGFSQRELADKISEASGDAISGGNYAALEKLDEPTTTRQQRVAAWACAICDVDFADLDLDTDALFRTPVDLAAGQESVTDTPADLQNRGTAR